MKQNYTVEQSSPTTFWLKFDELNLRKESLTIELSLCKDDSNSKRSLPKLWYSFGYTDKVLETYWCVSTYVKDSEGYCWGKYNPQSKMEGKRTVINFDWMLEGTEENKEKLIDETYKRFSQAAGKSATEEKLERIREFATLKQLEIVDAMPEGWYKMNYATDPSGCVSVCNTRATLKARKEGTLERKLLLI